jgi:hypothetical protein
VPQETDLTEEFLHDYLVLLSNDLKFSELVSKHWLLLPRSWRWPSLFWLQNDFDSEIEQYFCIHIQSSHEGCVPSHHTQQFCSQLGNLLMNFDFNLLMRCVIFHLASICYCSQLWKLRISLMNFELHLTQITLPMTFISQLKWFGCKLLCMRYLSSSSTCEFWVWGMVWLQTPCLRYLSSLWSTCELSV